MKKILDYLCDAQISFLDLDFFVHGGVASGIWSWSPQVNLSPVYLYILVMFANFLRDVDGSGQNCEEEDEV